MTKTERLWSLVSYIRENRAVSVTEMADHFKVSQRTIYRDLNTLSRMNVPIYFEDGFRLDSTYNVNCADLSADEMELIMFCLDHNPLVGEPYFDERFAAIKDLLKRVRKGPEHVEVERLIVGDGQARAASHPDGREALKTFFEAVLKRHKIRVNVLHSWQEGLYIPLSLNVRSDGIRLVVARSQSSRPQEFALSAVTQVSMASEKFDRRPIELLRNSVPVTTE